MIATTSAMMAMVRVFIVAPFGWVVSDVDLSRAPLAQTPPLQVRPHVFARLRSVTRQLRQKATERANGAGRRGGPVWWDASMAKAYVLCDITVSDPEGYEEYKRLAGAAVTQYGGRYVVRGGAVEALEGEAPTGRIVLLEFDSADAARAWYGSPEYTAARAVREKTTSRSTLALVAGV